MATPKAVELLRSVSSGKTPKSNVVQDAWMDVDGSDVLPRAATQDGAKDGLMGFAMEEPDFSPLQRTMTQASASASLEQAGAESTLQRTASQAAKQAKILSVMKDLDDKRAPVQELRRAVSDLGRSTDRASAEPASEALQDAAASVERARRQAREFNEDLVEDMLVLDGLSGLAAEDRTSRKRAISSIEALLSDVDSATERLGGLQRRLRSELEAFQQREQQREREQQLREQQLQEQQLREQQLREQQQREQQLEQLREQQRRQQEQQRQRQAAQQRQRLAAETEAAEGLAQAPSGLSGWRPAPQSARSPPRRVPEVQEVAEPEAPPLLPPGQDLWRALPLELRFRSRAVAGGYEIAAQAPGLHADDVSVELSEDGSVLTVSGLRQPSREQAQQLQEHVAALLLREARSSPQRFRERVAWRLQEVADESYARLGRGRFGRFSESFRVPQDAEVEGLQASCRDGVLRLVLPRRAPRPARWMADDGLGDRLWRW